MSDVNVMELKFNEENLLGLLKRGNYDNEVYCLVGIVSPEIVTGKRMDRDSDEDKYSHYFLDSYQASEDSYHGFEYIPLESGNYLKFEYYT